MINENKLKGVNCVSYIISVLKGSAYQDLLKLHDISARDITVFNYVLAAQYQIGYEQGLKENTLEINQSIDTVNGNFTGVKIDFLG